jgi:5,5'-dehydrodivanillate O-demethylase
MENAGRTARSNRLSQLTHVDATTSMGRLLRQFWQPVALSASIANGSARPLEILGENLTLFRGASGTAYLIGGTCAHRCTVLHTGWVQGDKVRCMYHGWQYDGTGQCTEMPAEPHADPALIRIAGFPLHEYSGLIFAYMGDGPAPEFDLPRKHTLEQPDCDLSVHQDIWDCNWFQHIENSLDATHVSYVHQWGGASELGAAVGTAIPVLTYEETTAGIRQTATRPDNVRISDWTFPNNNHIRLAPPRKEDPWAHTSAWQVPIDDESTLRFTLTAYPNGELGKELVRAGLPPIGSSMAAADLIFKEHRLPDGVLATDRLLMQDYAALRGQGTLVDRTAERLGASDAGVALLRRIALRELDAIQRGVPTKAWRRIEQPFEMPTPVAAS